MKKVTFKKLAPYIGASIVLLIALVAIYAVIIGPTKEPYREALAQYKVVYSANVNFSNIGSKLGSGSVSAEQFHNNITSARTALDNLNNQTRELGKQEVLKNGEGYTLYTMFTKQLQAYTKYNVSILNTLDKARPALLQCNQTSVNISTNQQALDLVNKCIQALDKTKVVDDQDYQQLITTFINKYQVLADNINRSIVLAELAEPASKEKNDAKLKQLEDERNQIITELSDASSTLSANLQKHRQEVDITQTAKALDDYLSRNSRVL